MFPPTLGYPNQSVQFGLYVPEESYLMRYTSKRIAVRKKLVVDGPWGARCINATKSAVVMNKMNMRINDRTIKRNGSINVVITDKLIKSLRNPPSNALAVPIQRKMGAPRIKTQQAPQSHDDTDKKNEYIKLTKHVPYRILQNNP